MQPRPNDVLFGRGKSSRTHPGNQTFHNLIETYSQEYEKETRFGKTIIAGTITQLIQKNGGRFLRCTSSSASSSKNKKNNVLATTTWEIATDIYARDRVAHTFRNNRRKKVGTTTTAT